MWNKADTKLLITMPFWIIPAFLGAVMGLLVYAFIGSFQSGYGYLAKWLDNSGL